MRFEVKATGIKLYNSYNVSKLCMRAELLVIKSQTNGLLVWSRSMKSLVREWACHNASYALGIAKDKTKDVDLDNVLPWYMDVLYNVVGIIVWPFIK